MAKRDDIVSELTRRVRSTFDNNINIVEGDAKIYGKWNTALPCVHFFEHPSKRSYSPTKQPGRYSVMFPVQLEYISRLSRKDQLYSEGRVKFLQLQQGVELDERFTQMRGQGALGSDLVDYYYMAADQIVEIVESVIDVVLVYEFYYVDYFYGYNPRT